MDSMTEYINIVKNKVVTVCPKCGSHNTTNYNFFDKAECYECHYNSWDKKFDYKTVGMFS